MKHIALFNGIGGFQLAAQLAGWENVASVEIDEFCNKITKYHFPDCIQYEDIKTFDGTIYRGAIDIITGGFPCQPFSQAGKRKGTDDNRYLWPEMLRVIREIQPSYVVAENVSGILSLDGGLVFEQVCLDLENEGYEVQPVIIPACAVNAPHRRDRVWFVAYRNDTRNSAPGSRINGIGAAIGEKWEQPFIESDRHVNERFATDTDSNGQQWDNSKHEIEPSEGGIEQCNEESATDTNGIGLRGESYRLGKSGIFSENGAINDWRNFPTVSPLCGGNDGLSERLDASAVFNRPCKPKHAKPYPKWRSSSIKAYGNAIVPQIALNIFRAIYCLKPQN